MVDNSEHDVNLIECFPSYQGEGVDTGKSMLILRFKSCTGNCPWCDTKDKMKKPEFGMTIWEIQNIIDEEKLCGPLITGGEPTFSSSINDNFQQTLFMLKELRYKIANVESNGHNLLKLITLVEKNNVTYSYSPKIFNKDDFSEALILSRALFEIDNVYFKVVYPSEPGGDLIEAYLDLISRANINHRIFLMPQGTTKEMLLENSKNTLKAAKKFKVNFSSRCHIIHDFT